MYVFFLLDSRQGKKRRLSYNRNGAVDKLRFLSRGDKVHFRDGVHGEGVGEVVLVDWYRRSLDVRSKEETLCISVHDLLDEGRYFCIYKIPC